MWEWGLSNLRRRKISSKGMTMTDNVFLRFICLIFLILTACVACQNLSDEEKGAIDQLNDKAYKAYYVKADSVVYYAEKALAIHEKSYGYNDGRDEALCHIGFARYMTMDYDSASVCLKNVLDYSTNELYRLVADVIMMKICQRRSVNKAFYDYYNDALQKMERIRPEVSSMNERQTRIWNFAVSEFHLTLYVYYYYLRQEEDGDAEMKFITDNYHIVEDDAQQRLMFFFLFGNAKNVDNRLTEDNTSNLLEAATEAKANNLNYILAKSLTSVAEDLIKQTEYRPSRINLIKEIIEQPDSADDKSMPLDICLFALDIFQNYGSLFDVAQTYNTIADFYIAAGDNEKALSAMQSALDCVNIHHKRVSNDNDVLYAYPDSAQFAQFELQRKALVEKGKAEFNSTEMKWIADSVVCLPEWMADIREHFCIVYSAMGLKAQSDYNRNIFLDIRDITRQDKRMEQILATLQKEQADVNRYMIFAAVFLTLFAFALVYLTRKVKNNYLRNFMQEQKSMEQEMVRWREKTDLDFSNLEEHQEMAMAERISKERRLDEQKRQYINKATCLAIVYAITPFLDRAVNEVRKIREDISGAKDSGGQAQQEQMIQDVRPLVERRLNYVAELIERINVYNDILSSWIKIRQGEVSLNIENFPLMPLFDILKANLRSFKAKGIELIIRDTESVVKADRALTLFMMNTLLENARKYSFDRGEVELYSKEEDGYVEVSVKDQGRGMTQEDVNTILGEKVYDSAKIGDTDSDEELKKNKGFGFGLLNCKGIIEKYKKTNSVFSVCKFGIESQVGKGSRFFFRLPKGTVRNKLMMLALVLPLLFSSCHHEKQQLDDVHTKISAQPNDSDVILANYFVQDLFNANVNQQYQFALQMADSVIFHLNKFYMKQNPDSTKIIKIYDEKAMAEVEWWNDGFITDYQTIMQMRNEVAIAALALKQWNLYFYNNEIFNRLHKNSSQDKELDARCNEIKQANGNGKTLLFLVITAILTGAVIYYFIYYKNNILPTFAMRQILELNRRIFNNEDEKSLATIIRQGVNEVRRTNGVVLCMGKDKIYFSENCPQQEYLESVIRDAFEKKANLTLDNGKTRIYTLDIDNGATIGVIAFLLYSDHLNDNDERMLRNIAKYTAENIYYSSVRMESINDNIEIIEDEKRRADREANLVHVQNLVIDNTLSTIKHETMYYPNRIRQIVDNISKTECWNNLELLEDNVNSMAELTSYYKEIFTILADCTAKQIQRPMFKRKNIKIAEVAAFVEKTVKKYARKYDTEVNFVHQPKPESYEWMVVADQTMLFYLIENVVEALYLQKNKGTLTLNFEKSQEFIKFAFSFDNIKKSQDEIKSMFYPEALVYDPQLDRLNGAQMLIAKQIIREHDEHVRRGCRIYASQLDNDGNGLQLCFTIPAAREATCLQSAADS